MPGKTRNGKTPYKFIGKARDVYVRYQKVKGLRLMPCRQCIGCRLEKSRQWATRAVHELAFHEKACFLTLTYDDDHLPKNRSLIRSDFTTFIKDLRARCSYYGKEKIKYFACGEYGDQTGRPHYHAILYGPFSGDRIEDFSDQERVREEPSRGGDPQFSHSDISAVWTHGLHRLSAVTFESAAYVARYQLKKVSGARAAAIYGDRLPEFQAVSQGFGRDHFRSWGADVYPGDQVVLPGRGAFMPPPYYDRLLEKVDPALYAQVKKKRAEAQEELTPETFLDGVYERSLKEEVRELVTEQTLIRGHL